MSKAPCRTKVSFDSPEEGAALSLPGTNIYRCPQCNKYHASSRGKSDKKKKREWLYRKRR